MMDELRDRYLQDKLTEAERVAFEEGLSTQEKEELALEIGVREGLRNEFRKEIKTTLQGFEEKKKPTVYWRPVYTGIAASILLLGICIPILLDRDTPSGMFEEYYTVYPNYELTTTRDQEQLNPRLIAYAFYDQAAYEKSIRAFSQLDKMLPADLFFRGMANLAKANYESAMTDLQSVIEKKDKDYSEPALWYLALIHIKQEQPEKAVSMLNKLKESSTTYADQASELLKELKQCAI